MNSKTSSQFLVGSLSFSLPVIICLVLGITGCASGARPSLTGLWKRKPAEEKIDKADSSKRESDKSVASKSKEGSKKPSTSKSADEISRSSKSKAKPGSTAGKLDDKETVTSQSSRRDRLRSYLKDEDEKKSSLSKSDLADDDPIRQVSKADIDEEDGLLSSLTSRKRTIATDPFLDEEDPISAASKLKSKSSISEKRSGSADPDTFEDDEGPNDLDRDMADIGMKKRSAVETESINRLESLLEESEADNAVNEKRVAQKVSSSRNPFEEDDDDLPVVTKKQEPRNSIPNLNDEPEIKTASIEDDVLEKPSTALSQVSRTSNDSKSRSASNSPRAQADDLILQALAKMKKNEFDEACSLAESAAKLEEDHQLEYAAGEESPTKLLSQLNQLRSMMAQDGSSSFNPKTSKPDIHPNPVSLPSLSNELQPIDDETAGLLNHSATRRVSYTKTEKSELEEDQLGVDTAQAVESGMEDDDSVAKSSRTTNHQAKESTSPNPFEDLGDDEIVLDADKGPAFGMATSEDGEESKTSEAITTFASSVSDRGASSKQTRKGANDSLGMMLIGISLVSLGCAGVFVWRAMRPSVANTAAAVAAKSDPPAKKAA
ncbi:MAG: hypothetical protein KDA36_01350 [Planctomycetaceae bacterium]|nr:hypothetical protein [Planctomycetaceae bacterium]